MKEGAWTTLSKNSPLRNETPRVRVVAYPMRSTQLRATIEGFASVAKDDTKAFYKNLYPVKKSEKKVYVFPYFNNDFRSFSNEFADTLSNITDRGAVSVSQVVKNIGDEFAGGAAQVSELIKNIKAIPGSGGPSTGTYIETPKFYQFDNTDAALSVSFPLLNTVDEKDISQNQQFIEEFTKINRPERQNSISMDFPHIYKVHVKGLRFIRWAYLDNLSFSMVGQRRLVGKKMVPEAYVCTMSFKSLTVEVANFIDQL